MKQAEYEGLDILTIPLGGSRKETSDPGRHAYVDAILDALKPLRVKGLVFGDLHLRYIREWREKAFSGVYPCRFPLFNVPYEELLRKLWKEEGITVRVSSVSHEFALTKGLSVGRIYDQALISDLPDEVDPMGERGEFHTHVHHHERQGGGASLRRRQSKALSSASAFD